MDTAESNTPDYIGELRKLVCNAFSAGVPAQEIIERVRAYDCPEYDKNAVLQRLHMGANNG